MVDTCGLVAFVVHPVSHNFTREKVSEDPQIRSVGLGKKLAYFGDTNTVPI
jgi:hypothetical protein